MKTDEELEKLYNLCVQMRMLPSMSKKEFMEAAKVNRDSDIGGISNGMTNHAKNISRQEGA